MLTVEAYRQRKAALEDTRTSRARCFACHKPAVSCYCSQLKPIKSSPRILILMHPLEAAHPIGTGRMAHRCLSNSQLWVGENFAQSKAVNELINDPKLFPLLLFPGPQSRDISALAPTERTSLCPPDREPVVIILDATWDIAKKMLFHSPNLQTLPRICFQPSRLSRFLIRKQPNPQCFSTIEAIHETLCLLDPTSAPEGARPHDHLLEVFDAMVAKQLSYRSKRPDGRSRHSLNYEARKARRQKWRARRKELEARKAAAAPCTM